MTVGDTIKMANGEIATITSISAPAAHAIYGTAVYIMWRTNLGTRGGHWASAN